MREYKITYKFEGKEYWTTWCASEEKYALAHFEMWHPGVEVISIEKYNR